MRASSVAARSNGRSSRPRSRRSSTAPTSTASSNATSTPAPACRLRAALADHDDRSAPTESEFEERFLAFCKNARLPLPERQVYIDPNDGEPAVRGDFVWRQQRLVVETDGVKYHRTKAAFESDRRKDQRLTLAGWRVLRITWRQLKAEPERIAKMIRRALGLR